MRRFFMEARRKIIRLYYVLSIKKKIFLCFFMESFALLVVLAVLSSVISSNSLIQKAIDNTAQYLKMVSGKFDIVFDNVENDSKIVIRNHDIQDTLSLAVSRKESVVSYNEKKTVQKVLRGMIEPATNIDAMLIYDFNENIYDSGNVQFIEQNIESGNPAHLYSDTTKWVGTHKSVYQKLYSEQNVVSFYKNFVDEDTGNPLGILEICINEKYIASLYSDIVMKDGGNIFIADKNGTILSDDDKNRLYGTIRDETYYSWVKTHEGGKIFRNSGNSFLIVCEHYDRLDWIIVGVVPMQIIVGDSRLLAAQIISVGILCIILAAFITILLSSSITQPIIRLKNTIKRVGEGDLQAKVDIRSEDEVGILAREFNKMVKKISELMRKNITAEQQKKKYEMALLHEQINPHFLYNTLESICGLAELGKTEDIIYVVEELALFYREILSEGSMVVAFKDEFMITERYLNIMKARYGEQLAYQFDIDPQVYQYYTLKLMIQPLVENAIYHGLKYIRDKGMIRIEGAIDKDGDINIRIIDNGIGIKPEAIKRIFDKKETNVQKNFGLKNIDERIKLYFGPGYGLTIRSEYNEGTTVLITLPKKRMGEIIG